MLAYILITIAVFPINFFHFTHGTAVTNSSEDNEAIRYAKAEEMVNYMDRIVDPCDDFYKFACGNWPLSHPATYENKQTLYFHQVSYNYMDELSAILGANDTSDTETLKKVKNFYRSCLNVSPVKSVYKDKLVEIVREFGEMPVLQGNKRWQVENFDWMAILGQIAYKYNKKIIFDFEKVIDPLNNKRKKIELRPAKFALGEFSLYLNPANEQYRSAHRTRIAEDLREFLDINPSLAASTANDIVEFEIMLVQGIKYIASSQNLKLNALQEKYIGQLDFKELLRTAMDITTNIDVIENFPTYQRNLVNIMAAIEKSKVANFIFYYLLRDFMEVARRPDKSPQQACIYTTRRFFHPFLENMMYHAKGLSEAATGVQNMFADLKAIFQSNLSSDNYKWISNPTRLLAIEKLKSMKLKINSYDNIDFDHLYGRLAISSNAFMENLKNLFTQFGTHARSNGDDKAPIKMYDETDILFGPGYIIKDNCVVIPIISLLPHYFWSASFPKALNLGQLGSVVAHEIVHGFDNNGRYIDQEGKFRDWWDSHSTNNFTQRTQCFKDQYKRYMFGEIPLAARNDQGENIADNGGVSLAYEAYMNWYNSPWIPKALVHEEKMPGMDYTGSQLFFIGFAQIWCSDIHPYYRSLLTATDHHTPAKFRVIGSLSNMKEFAEAFKCRPGSAMNPENKCHIY